VDDRVAMGWLRPILLVVVGIVLVLIGGALTRDATARYDTALSTDCPNAACHPIGPLSAQPEYQDGLVATTGALLVFAIAVFFAARHAGWLGSPGTTPRQRGRP
jgi:hypothetical protein